MLEVNVGGLHGTRFTLFRMSGVVNQHMQPIGARSPVAVVIRVMVPVVKAVVL